MKHSIDWFAKNSVAANLVMVLIVAGGVLTIPKLKQEVFPEYSSDLISVSVDYLGASPSEVEEGVCSRIEEATQGIAGVKRIRSTAVEGRGTVNFELMPREDAREALEKIKARIDTFETIPQEAEKPLVQEVTLRRQVVDVAVTGPRDEKSLRRVAERVRDQLTALPEISIKLAKTAENIRRMHHGRGKTDGLTRQRRLNPGFSRHRGPPRSTANGTRRHKTKARSAMRRSRHYRLRGAPVQLLHR